jgi:hypothetical protein
MFPPSIALSLESEITLFNYHNPNCSIPGSNLEALYSCIFLHVTFSFEISLQQAIAFGQNAMPRFRVALIRCDLLLDNLSVDRDESPPPSYPLIPASVPFRLLHLEACSFVTCITLILSFLSLPSRPPAPQIMHTPTGRGAGHPGLPVSTAHYWS